MRRIGRAKLRHNLIRNKTGDDGLAGFADDQFALLQGADIRGHGALQRFHSQPGGSNGTATSDGNVSFVHGCFQKAFQVLSRSSMNGGQFKISSPAGVVKTWLVLPVASSVPSAARRIS